MAQAIQLQKYSRSMFKRIFSAVALIAFSLMVFAPVVRAAEANLPVDVQEIFTSKKQVYGDTFSYPKGNAEMRLYKVDVEAGATIPLHSHPAPLIGHIQEGQLTLKTKQGKSQTFRAGDSFLLAADTPPHTMANAGKAPAVMWVSVASAEGIPTLTNVE